MQKKSIRKRISAWISPDLPIFPCECSFPPHRYKTTAPPKGSIAFLLPGGRKLKFYRTIL